MKLLSIKSLSFCLIFFLGCTQVDGESLQNSKILEGNILHEASGKPLSGVKVFLFKLNKPLFSMRNWEEVASVETTESGFFTFEFNESGPYEVRWNPEQLVVAHEFSIVDFDGKKHVEILHENREKKTYPWSP
tara:strand:+ start:359 stop:757 length:399 start_codon:yes stop_codon:yes gene_type:complete